MPFLWESRALAGFCVQRPRPTTGAHCTPTTGQELRQQLESAEARATGLQEQLSESQRELQASRSLLQEERQDLLGKLEAQSREAQWSRVTSELLGR